MNQKPEHGAATVVPDTVLESLDAHSAALLPHLPYLLQDLFELGSSPEVIARMLGSQRLGPGARVLDLGCGKGAVSLRLARELGTEVLGIDGMPVFVEEARARAEREGLQALCRFEAGDLREVVERLTGFDAVLLGGTGPVFGSFAATLRGASRPLARGGLLLIDEVFVEDGEPRVEGVLSRSEMLAELADAGLAVVEVEVTPRDELREVDRRNEALIRKRAEELAAMRPESAELVRSYVRSQEEAGRVVEEQVRAATWLLCKR